MIEKISYQQWSTCYRLQHGEIEAVLLADLGPRIIHFGFAGGRNHFSVIEKEPSVSQENWHLLGGHRLWLAPEDISRTYLPDNQPVPVSLTEDTLHAVPPVHPASGIQKELVLTPGPIPNSLQVLHRLTNLSQQAELLAPWALSVMAPGGCAILPLPPRQTPQGNLLPTSSLALWSYTDLSDSRYEFGRDCLLIRHQPGAGSPQKIGVFNPAGWLAYWQGGELFVKTQPGLSGTYPDIGCNLEIYFDADILELETLAPLINLAPGDTAEHLEHWILLKDMPSPESPAVVSRKIIPAVDSAVQALA